MTNHNDDKYNNGNEDYPRPYFDDACSEIATPPLKSNEEGFAVLLYARLGNLNKVVEAKARTIRRQVESGKSFEDLEAVIQVDIDEIKDIATAYDLQLKPSREHYLSKLIVSGKCYKPKTSKV